MSQRVVITGIGVVSSIGSGKDEFWKAALSGACGVRKLTAFDASNHRSKVSAEVQGFDPQKCLPEHNIDRLDRFAQFGMVASKMAVEDSGLDVTSGDPYRIGVCMGSGMGGMVMGERQITALVTTGRPEKVNPNSIPMITLNAASGQIAMQFGIKGPNTTTSTA